MTAFTGTGALVRLILRRDRIKFLIWIVLVSLVPIGVAAWRTGLNGAFLIVPVCILFVIRHMRSEEVRGGANCWARRRSGNSRR